MLGGLCKLRRKGVGNLNRGRSQLGREARNHRLIGYDKARARDCSNKLNRARLNKLDCASRQESTYRVRKRSFGRFIGGNHSRVECAREPASHISEITNGPG